MELFQNSGQPQAQGVSQTIYHGCAVGRTWAGGSNGCERPCPLPGGGAVPQPWQYPGLCRQTVCVSLASPRPTWQGSGSGGGSGEAACGSDLPKLCHQQGLRNTGLLTLTKGGCVVLQTSGSSWANPVSFTGMTLVATLLLARCCLCTVALTLRQH